MKKLTAFLYIFLLTFISNTYANEGDIFNHFETISWKHLCSKQDENIFLPCSKYWIVFTNNKVISGKKEVVNIWDQSAEIISISDTKYCVEKWKEVEMELCNMDKINISWSKIDEPMLELNSANEEYKENIETTQNISETWSINNTTLSWSEDNNKTSQTQKTNFWTWS
jgi:hypothetical protein